ncbi:HigA family addiction module antidote protein [Duganella sp. FT80W]|uniref:HigA family addiction module antidote protein n=1 Tax=Duganella guangzhouensis TaxID=2666084 RepID=A0A6I2L0U8_9BURK|nr:HigA family addiction module antitoxin [Duganella guangzhouensis]MRW90344.1 HigA family addiction module antidote protein [Duganella guangzhouensis]
MNALRNPESRPTHPGAILREDVLPALKISLAEFAQRLGISQRSLHELLQEQRPLSAEMATHLASFLKTSPESWLRMQRDFDNWIA